MKIKINEKAGILLIGVSRVWFRNALVFRRNIRVNLLPPFIEPLLYLGAIGFGIGAYITDIEGVPYIRFIAPAILAASVMNASFFECAYGTYVRMYYQKTFDALLATPITIQEVILGEIFWGATRGLISALSISIVLLLLGLASPVGLLIALPFSFLAGVLFSSIAACFSAVSPSIDTMSYPATLFVAPMFLFSGTFFPLHLLPQIVQVLALLLLPLTHVVSLIRGLLTETSVPLWAFNISWIVMGTIIFSFLAIRLFKRRLVV